MALLTTVLHKTKIYVLFSFFLFDIIDYFQISSLDENWFYKNWQSRVATLLLPSIHSTRLLSKGDHCIVRIKFDIYVFFIPMIYVLLPVNCITDSVEFDVLRFDAGAFFYVFI
jgi:hypothetical protein